MNKVQDDLTSKKRLRDTTPALEWAMSALGLLIVLSVLSLIAYNAVKGIEGPPLISTEVLKVSPNGSGYLVMIRVANKGVSTASELEIEGELKWPGDKGEAEKSSLTLSYLPADSTRTGGLFFTHDPGAGELSIRPVGFQEP